MQGCALRLITTGKKKTVTEKTRDISEVMETFFNQDGIYTGVCFTIMP
jgi:hypothetical protein